MQNQSTSSLYKRSKNNSLGVARGITFTHPNTPSTPNTATMRAFLVLSCVASTMATSWAVGSSALAAYLIYGGDTLWDGMIQKFKNLRTKEVLPED